MAFAPTRYQGWGRLRRYFEGWYFKVVDPKNHLAYALIPGVSMDAEGQKHAFIQVLNGVEAKSSYHRFPFSDFAADRNKFAVSIGENSFSTTGCTARLPGLSIAIRHQDVQPWPSRPLAPGVMGWYGFVPGMQCYHGLVSLHHRINGQINGLELSDVAVGYIEKDWGSSFPNAWIWAQTNHLDHPAPNSLMISVADIPWLGRSFVGFLSTFLFEGELHTMATWTGAKAEVSVMTNEVAVLLSDRRRQLKVVGKPGAGGNLASPIAGGMTGKINESLQAELEITFILDGQVRYQGPARWAGLEVTDNAKAVLA